MIGGVEASWTPTAATVLDVVLRAGFEPGVPLGSLAVHANASADHPYPATDVAEAIPGLSRGATTVTVGPAALSTLHGASVAVTPTGRTTESPRTAKGRVLSFPVTAGMVVIHKNHEYKPGFVTDPGDSVLTANVGSNPRFPLFLLNGSDFKDQVAQLTPAAARLLDRTFASTAFTPYLTVGPLAVIAQP